MDPKRKDRIMLSLGLLESLALIYGLMWVVGLMARGKYPSVDLTYVVNRTFGITVLAILPVVMIACVQGLSARMKKKGQEPNKKGAWTWVTIASFPSIILAVGIAMKEIPAVPGAVLASIIFMLLVLGTARMLDS